MNIGNKLKEKFLHKKTSCDPYWENERKITSDNIVELSQFKVGDIVTLITHDSGKTMKISCIELFPNIFKHLIIPNVSVDDFKQRFEVNEDYFIFTLIDDDGHEKRCFVHDVIKGIVTENELKSIVKKRNKKRIRQLLLLLISIPLFVVSYLTRELIFPLSFVFLLATAFCLFLWFINNVFILKKSIIKGKKDNKLKILK